MAIRRKLKFKDAASFAAALRHESRVRFPTFLKEVQVGIVSRVYEGVLLKTPVLTGRARASWNLSVSRPLRGRVDPDQRIQIPGFWFSTTGEPMNSDEKGVLASVAAAVRGMTIGRNVFLTNTQPYIEVLESGIGSAKARFGMVEITLDWVQGSTQRNAIVREALRRAK